MKPLALIILDGYGWAEPSPGNAISQAKTPFFDQLWQKYPHTLIHASGEAVGLPEGQMGNSEVGHLNIGAGRVVPQTLQRINQAITDGELERRIKSLGIFNNLDKLHLIGLVSDGGVHSSFDHLVATIKLAKKLGVKQVFVHAITDGRDTAPQSGIDFIQALDLAMIEIGLGQIATVSGRYYAMDRDKRWERTDQAYQAMVLGQGLKAESGEEALAQSYAQNITDEFLKPHVINPQGYIQAGDSVLCINFRPDRMIQLAKSLADLVPNELPSAKKLGLNLTTMTSYQANLPVQVLFPPEDVEQTLGSILAEQQISQHRIAETEKYAHVTYFFDGGKELDLPLAKRTLIPSPKVATYDLQPEMSAVEVTQAILDDLATKTSQMLIVNYANPDMVGHTGNIPATIEAIEAIDQQLAKIIPAILERDGTAIITADHGNAEKLLDEKNQPYTAHTSNPVPLIITKEGLDLIKDGKLANIAPTILELLEIEQPKLMSERSLIL